MSNFSQQLLSALTISACVWATAGVAQAQTPGTASPSSNDASATRSTYGGSSTTDRPGAGTPGSDQQPSQTGTDNASGNRDGSSYQTNPSPSQGYGNQVPSGNEPANGATTNQGRDGTGSSNRSRPARSDRG